MNKKFVRHLGLIVVISAITGMICFGGIIWSSSKSKADNIIINNHTLTCQVISAKKHNGHIKLSLRNDSNKNITALVISSVTSPGNNFTVKEEFAYSENDSVIAPGSIYEMILSIPSSLSNQKKISLDLTAVVFDDKSSEGDPKVVQGIEDERLGEKVQLTQLIPLLEKMLAQPDSELPIYFNEHLKREITTASNGAEKGLLVQMKKERPQMMSQQESDELPDQMQQGLHSGKEYFLNKIQDLENLQKTQGGNILREEITRIKRTCEKIVGRL